MPQKRVPRNPNELGMHLKKQIVFLRNSCALYDAGEEAEAERIASTLRLLLHHQGRSQALLVQLGLRDTILFHDVMGPCPPLPNTPNPGGREFMVRFGAGGLSIGGRQSPVYTPNLGEPVRKVPFGVWWDEMLIVRSLERIQLARRDIVLEVANTDGGAHVDASIPEQYAAVVRDEAFIGEIRSSTRGVLRPRNNPVLASLRQIAHEVEGTLQENVSHLL